MASAIWKELEKRNLSGVKKVIQLYPNSVNFKGQDNRTPLHAAVACGADFVKDLLAHGAPYDAADSHGNLALHLAVEQGDMACVNELLAGPARKLTVKVKNKDGQTPLHFAVRNGHLAVVRKLCECGARTDAKDKANQTPFDLSVQGSDINSTLMQYHPVGSSSMSMGTPTGRAPVDGTPSRDTATSTAAATTTTAANASPALNLAAVHATQTPTARGTPRASVAASPSAAPGSARARGAIPAPGGGTPAAGSRLPQRTKAADPGTPAGGGGVPGGTGMPVVGLTPAVQLQKHDAALEALRGEMAEVKDKLGLVDFHTRALAENAAMITHCKETDIAHARQLNELESRLGFQEERGKDARGRLERLEEGERALQDTTSRLATDQRSLAAQLRELADSLSRKSEGGVSSSSLHVDLAALRAQVEQLTPALAVATAASAEARALGSRVDGLQAQVLQHGAPGGGGSSSAALEQQVAQLQAQVQLLQLPVAGLTQQCADLSSRVTGLSEWQQQARVDLGRLAEAAKHQGPGGGAGSVPAEALMVPLQTTTELVGKLKDQQDETARQVALLMQHHLQHLANGGAGAAAPAEPGTPAVPGTPNGMLRRASAAGQDGQTPMTPSRHTSVGGGAAAQVQAQADLRAELEALKEQLVEMRKEVASEGGSLRREWQRAFSDMQQRYGEQANELRAREANIAKLREAAMTEEAERVARSALEDKVVARMAKLETSVEYLTHRLEVLEEQVSGLTALAQGASSPLPALSPPGRTAAGGPAQRPGATPKSTPGPVAENVCYDTPSFRLAASLVSSLGPAQLPGSGQGQRPSASSVSAAAEGRTGRPMAARKGQLFGTSPTGPVLATTPKVPSGVEALGSSLSMQAGGAPGMPAMALDEAALAYGGKGEPAGGSGLAGLGAQLGQQHSQQYLCRAAPSATAPTVPLLCPGTHAMLTPSVDFQLLASAAGPSTMNTAAPPPQQQLPVLPYNYVQPPTHPAHGSSSTSQPGEQLPAAGLSAPLGLQQGQGVAVAAAGAGQSCDEGRKSAGGVRKGPKGLHGQADRGGAPGQALEKKPSVCGSLGRQLLKVLGG